MISSFCLYFLKRTETDKQGKLCIIGKCYLSNLTHYIFAQKHYKICSTDQSFIWFAMTHVDCRILYRQTLHNHMRFDDVPLIYTYLSGWELGSYIIFSQCKQSLEVYFTICKKWWFGVDMKNIVV